MVGKKDIREVSNPEEVYRRAREYGIPRANIRISLKKDKKYDVFDEQAGKWVSFGDASYQDYTKHKDNERRARYIARASNIPGDWKKNKYSPGNLSLYLLW